MAKIAEMAQLSPTMTEGTIVKWLKKVGDKVSVGDIVAEVETDKAVMEMESYDNGVLLSIIIGDGEKVKVGLPVAIIGKAGEDISALESSAKSKLSSVPAATVVVEAPKPQKPPEVVAPKPVELKVEEKIPEVVSPKKEKRTDGRILASPLAKSIALSKGVDITKVIGSGPEGRITKLDVLEFIANPSSSSSSSMMQSYTPAKLERKLEISGMRKIIATRLHDAKNNIPHFYLNLEFDAEPLVKMREMLNLDLKSQAERKKEKPDLVSLNDFIVKACSITLSRIPEVNSSWRGDHILEHGRVDIGIAVSMDGGLITPYVRNADKLSLVEIHTEIKSLADKARNRKLKPNEFTDGTFTISNLGMFGITSFSAIINEPEAALMAVGGLVEKAVVKNGNIVAGKTITVTLSCDHRVVDGAVGAKFLGEFKEIIEHPYTIIR